MAVILTVVYSKGLRGFSGIVIGGILGLDVFFLGFISGASMNPARSWSMLCFQAFRLTCGFTGHHFYRNFFHVFIYRLSLDVARKTFSTNN
jgi:glycerol uptake facilitator-like aquaporin